MTGPSIASSAMIATPAANPSRPSTRLNAFDTPTNQRTYREGQPPKTDLVVGRKTYLIDPNPAL